MNKGPWLDILVRLGPMIGTFVPGLDPKVVPLIITGIVEATQLQGASNEEKKAYVVSLVKVGVTAINVATNKQAVNAEGLAAATSRGIDAIVQGVNAVHDHTSGTPTKS